MRSGPPPPLDPDDPILAAQSLLDTTIDAVEAGQTENLGFTNSIDRSAFAMTA